MPLTPEQIHDLNAVEAKKRELRVKLAKIRGELGASAAASKFFARINQDTQIQREQAEAELRALEESGAIGILDGWGMFTPTDRAAKSERKAGATRGYEWLLLNPTGDPQGFSDAVNSGMQEHATAAGRAQPLQRTAQLVPLWIGFAFAAKKISSADWPSFRGLLLAAVDLSSALENMD